MSISEKKNIDQLYATYFISKMLKLESSNTVVLLRYYLTGVLSRII